MSLREVQRLSGVSAARLSRIENGYVDPRVSTVEAILRALDADFGDLTAGIDASSQRPASDHLDPMVVVLRNRHRIHEILVAHGASRPRIFGSVARGEAGPGSDVDLLVDLEDGRTLFDLAGLRADLEDLLGTPVDVVPSAGLDGDARDEILAEALAL